MWNFIQFKEASFTPALQTFFRTFCWSSMWKQFCTWLIQMIYNLWRRLQLHQEEFPFVAQLSVLRPDVMTMGFLGNEVPGAALIFMLSTLSLFSQRLRWTLNSPTMTWKILPQDTEMFASSGSAHPGLRAGPPLRRCVISRNMNRKYSARPTV